MKKAYLILINVLISIVAIQNAQCQNDLLKLLDSSKKGPETILPTWKDVRLINAQTTKTTASDVMEFSILHRFGNAGGEGSGAFHTFYGFDIVSDVQFGFQFGVTKNLQLGFSRSISQELIDLDGKYRLLTQNKTTMPVSLALYEDIGITPELSSALGANTTYQPAFPDRLFYFSELLIDRRFSKYISLELLGGFQHRNYLLLNENLTNGSYDQNTIPFTGLGGRYMFTKHSGIVFDGYYLFSSYRTNNKVNPFYPPLSIGYEVETGGHVFEINFSNAAYLDENNIIPNTTDNWLKGGFKLGFSISRVFNL